MDIQARILGYAEILYSKALEQLKEERFRKAEINALAAAGASIFLERDEDSPPEIRGKARELSKTLENLVSAIWSQELEEYGERFLSGRNRKASALAESAFEDLREAATEAQKIQARR